MFPTPGRWLSQGFARILLRPPPAYVLVATGALSSPLRRGAGLTTPLDQLCSHAMFIHPGAGTSTGQVLNQSPHRDAAL
jgi:hypothetical protein